MFPVCIRHTHAFEPAIDGALPAIDTAVHVIFQDKAFCSAIQRDKLNGFGWAVFDTQATARACGRIVLQVAAKSFRRGGSFDRI